MAAIQQSPLRFQAFSAKTTKTSIKPQYIPSHIMQRGQMRTRPVTATLETLTSLVHPVLAAAEIDWTDPDVQIGALGAFLGIGLGIGTPLFYISREERDEERLEELRALNRATKAETGEYLSNDEIESIRPPRWTDRREFVDDD